MNLFLRCREVDINVCTPNGNNCWTLALIEKKYGVLMQLLSRSEVNVNTHIPGRGTALAVAVIDDQVELVRKLLAHKDIEVRGIGPNFEDLVTLAIASSNFSMSYSLKTKISHQKKSSLKSGACHLWGQYP